MKLFLFVSMFISFDLQAENHSYLIGGGGENNKNKTMYDESVNNLGFLNKFSKPENQNIYFNGGHPKLEKALKKYFPSVQKNKFTRSDYDKFIDKITNDIKTGKIKPGDQVLVNIESHGEVRNEKEVSHSIALKSLIEDPDLIKRFGREFTSLDRLIEVIDLAEAKGIKLGIIDQSCFGGGSIELGRNKRNVCVISGSSKNNVNYNTQQGLLNSKQKDTIYLVNELYSKSKNLEELVINVSSSVETATTPHASIKKYEEISENLEKEFYKFAYPQQAERGEIDECYDKNEFLKSLGKYIDKIDDSLIKNSIEYKNFIKEVEGFTQIAVSRRLKLKDLSIAYNEYEDYFLKYPSVFIFSTWVDGKKYDFSVNKADLLRINNPKPVDKFPNYDKLSADDKKIFEERYMSEKKRVDLLGTPIVERINRIKDYGLDTYNFKEATKLSLSFNKLRDKIYVSSIETKESNACRDFKL